MRRLFRKIWKKAATNLFQKKVMKVINIYQKWEISKKPNHIHQKFWKWVMDLKRTNHAKHANPTCRQTNERHWQAGMNIRPDGWEGGQIFFLKCELWPIKSLELWAVPNFTNLRNIALSIRMFLNRSSCFSLFQWDVNAARSVEALLDLANFGPCVWISSATSTMRMLIAW